MDKIYYPLLNVKEVRPLLSKISIFGGLNGIQLDEIFKLLKDIREIGLNNMSDKKDENLKKRDAYDAIHLVQATLSIILSLKSLSTIF